MKANSEKENDACSYTGLRGCIYWACKYFDFDTESCDYEDITVSNKSKGKTLNNDIQRVNQLDLPL